MFKHTVEYEDFNGNQRKEDLYFHLSVPEVTRLQAEIGGKAMDEYVKELSDNQNVNDLLDFLEKMLLNSYGQKTSDGRSFRKSKEARDEFEQSQAYAEMFSQLILEPDLARKFGSSVSGKTKASQNQLDPKVIGSSDGPKAVDDLKQ